MWGHQPAIAAYVRTAGEEMELITRNVLLQKLGGNPQTMKKYDEMVRRRKEKEDELEQQQGQHEQMHEDKGQQDILLKYAR